MRSPTEAAMSKRILLDLPRRRGARGASLLVSATLMSGMLSGCGTSHTHVNPSPAAEATKVESESTVDGHQNESVGKSTTAGDVAAIALMSPLLLAELPFVVMIVAPFVPFYLLFGPEDESTREKEISRERSEQLIALKQNVEKRTVLCPGRTSDQVLADMWKAVEVLGFHREWGRFESRRTLEVTGEPSLWLRAYAETSGQAGSPVLATVEVGAPSPEERRKYTEDFLSAFSKQSGIAMEELH